MNTYESGNKTCKNLIMAWLLTLVAMFVFMAYGLPFVLDQHEKERQWRADRLCQQGYYCNPKGGA